MDANEFSIEKRKCVIYIDNKLNNTISSSKTFVPCKNVCTYIFFFSNNGVCIKSK